jgi:hypothetical protein
VNPDQQKLWLALLPNLVPNPKSLFFVRKIKEHSDLFQEEKSPELPGSILFLAGMFDHKSQEDLAKRGIFSIPSGSESLRTQARTVRFGSELILVVD